MSVIERQKVLIDHFSYLETWEDKYSYIISLGKDIPLFPKERKNDSNLIQGCQSQVWFYTYMSEGKINFQGVSDAVIVSGIIALLIKIYSNSFPRDIVSSDTDFVKKIGLVKHLSILRQNGLSSLLNYIYKAARYHVKD